MKNNEIRALRERLHLTQKKLAESVGVQTNTVARWERGESSPSSAMLQRLRSVANEYPSGDAIARTSGLQLDLHHGAILRALQDRLDPDVFQTCAVFLLQRHYPGLVAVHGAGGDDGFDGAIADGTTSAPYPLIATVGHQPVKNFTENLDQARRKGWKVNRAVFATARVITAGIRRKLFSAARERHVKLIQIYDQNWFASRLYHEPDWCKRLLGVTGRPHALSIFPVTQRPVLGTQVLGREQQMQWLLDDSRGDCVLVGEPGSGKTFLLRSLALQGKARFLVDMNREQVANDLRSLQPQSVIVDDAHVHIDWLTDLTQIRSEVRSGFRIIAVSWPGDASVVRTALHVSHEHQCLLDRIDAGTMIEIVKSVGIAGPDELLAEIRRQAAGRPGLAATLVHLCLVGDIKQVVSGEGLVDQIESSFRSVLGSDSLTMLAPFALGGNAGVTKDKVAEVLGVSIKKVADTLAKLATSGVVLEIPENQCPEASFNWPLSVMPPRMRGALVNRIFYRGPGSLPIDRFFSVVRKPVDALETLIDARACGATIPDLEQRLEEANHVGLWLKYASLGRREVSSVLDRHPELIMELAEPSLFYVPETAVPMLLSEAAKDNRPDSHSDWFLPSSRKKVLDKLERWVSEDNIDRETLLAKRTTLLKFARKWWDFSRDADIALSAMCIALNPVYRYSRIDPGLGTTVTLTDGALSAEVIDELSGSWSLASEVMVQSLDLPWTKLFEFMEKFLDPRLAVDEGCSAAAKRFWQRIMKDLLLASPNHPGIQRRIGRLAETAGVEIHEASDSVFDCLYPCPQGRFDLVNLDNLQAIHMDKMAALAACWDNFSLDEIACRLARLEDEASLAGIAYPRLTPEFCKLLAERRSDSAASARVFMARQLPPDLVDPFIRRSIAVEKAPWSIVEDCLATETYKFIGISVAVADPCAPPEIVSEAIEQAKGYGQFIEHVCLRGEVSENVLFEFFRAVDEEVAVAAAVGHWQRAQNREIRSPLGKAWKRAILRSADGEGADSQHRNYWLLRVLRQEDKLAVEWLIRMVGGKPGSFAYHTGKMASEIAATLGEEQRRTVLKAVSPNRRATPITRELVGNLVGDFPKLYQELLDSKDLVNLHLAPLAGKPTQGWETKAILALDFGYSVDQIVDATQNTSHSWHGSESAMWAEWRCAFERLFDDFDPRIVRIGEQGSEMMLDREEKAKERERHRTIYGG